MANKMANKKRKYLVVGGAGFIGSHLVDKLIQLKHQVIVLDNLSTGKKENINPRAKFVKADIRKLKQITPFFKNIDGVFLLAALPRVQYSIDQPTKTNKNNIDGILNVLVASQQTKTKRIVYSSSSSIYGEPKKLPLKESFPPNPLSPYGLQKYVGEEYCRLFSLLYGLETVSLRYFNVYGPRMDDQGAYATVMSVFLRQLAKNQPLTITGDGTQTRDFTHISDVVKANLLAMESKKVGRGEAINIGGGKNYSINEIAKMFSNKVKYIAPRVEPHDTLADISLAKKLLGWQPKIKLEEGIRKLLKENLQ
jgi:UDP-glucose 4-epimerase